MAGRLPSVPILTPRNPELSIQQLAAYLNSLRGALEEKDSALDALGYNVNSPLWGGRGLPDSALYSVENATGLVGFGLYDAIGLVWDFTADPALKEWRVYRDGVLLDVTTINCYLDKPIGDLADHEYEIVPVSITDNAAAGIWAAVTVHAETDGEIIRDNFVAMITAWQTSAIAPHATGELLTSPRVGSFNTTSATRTPITDVEVGIPLASPLASQQVLIIASADEVVLTNNTGATAYIQGDLYITFDDPISGDLNRSRTTVGATVEAGASKAFEVPYAALIVAEEADLTSMVPPATFLYKLQASANPGGASSSITVNGVAIRALMLKR